MNRKIVFFIFLSVLAIPNLGTIRKAEDPIRDTQTNPILYEQKKEEEKDGKKGPLLYNVKNNPRESFFIDPPYEKDKKSSVQKSMTEAANEPAGTEGWWEEPATTSHTPSSAETGTELLPESSSEEEKVQDREVSDESTAATNAGNTPSDKGNDYWW